MPIYQIYSCEGIIFADTVGQDSSPGIVRSSTLDQLLLYPDQGNSCEEKGASVNQIVNLACLEIS